MATKSKTKTRAKSTKSTKSQAKVEAKASKPEATTSEAPKSETATSDTSKSETGKTETTKTDADAKASDGDGGGDSTSAKKSSGPAREISYFSSVSSNEYRSGWDGIFKAGGKKAAPQRANTAAKAARKSKYPATLSLDIEALQPKLRRQLDELFRQEAKKKRLNYDKLADAGRVKLQLACKVSKP
jgi:hypothetical protein